MLIDLNLPDLALKTQDALHQTAQRKSANKYWSKTRKSKVSKTKNKN